MKLGNLLFRGRFLLVLTTLAIVLLLVFAAIVVQAQTSTPSASLNGTAAAQTISGQVVNVAFDNNSFNIRSNAEQTTVNLDSKTNYFSINLSPFNLSAMIDALEDLTGSGTSNMTGMEGMSGSEVLLNGIRQYSQPATFNNITIGDNVIVQIPSGSPAGNVYDVKFPDNIKSIHGTISGVSANSMVITPASSNLGALVSLGWDVNSRLILKGLPSIQTGQSTFVIYDDSSGMIEIALISSTSTPASPSSTPAPTISSTPVSNAITVDLTTQNNKFDKDMITVPSGANVTIKFNNKDNGTQHNFSVYNNSKATTSLFKGTVITGPTTITYQFTVPDINVTYFFRCDIHPEENGKLIVGDAGE
jgi:plastocyanin